MASKQEPNAFHLEMRPRRTHALEYFRNVLDKLNKLHEVIEHTEDTQPDWSLYNRFERNKSIIDFILVFDTSAKDPAKMMVNNFLKSLIRDGFTTEGSISEIFKNLVFISIHCHRAKLIKAGITFDMHLGFLSEYDDASDYSVFFNFNFLFNDVTRPTKHSAVSQRSRDLAFNRKPSDITVAERIMVTYELLKHTRYGAESEDVGVSMLLYKNYLHAAFPLHDGPCVEAEEEELNDRQVLMDYWAASSNWYKLQPLNLIKHYFGSEVAFYFAFMGYFNKMLIVPALAGIVSVIYGLLTYRDERNFRTMEICESNITICPPCHDMRICHYERLNNECHTSQMAYIFDNILTAVYSIFWAFWSAIIYRKWERYQNVLRFRWNLLEVENESSIRPAYVIRATKHTDQNQTPKMRGKNEHGEPRFLQILRYCASGFTTAILILLVLAVIYIAVVIRWWIGLLIGRFDGQFSFQRRLFLLTTLSNVFIILFVCIAEDLFEPLARLITDFENHRTDEEYEQSFVYKYAVLCFITSYSFICYTAFLKGRFFSYPSHELQYLLLGIFNYDLEKIHNPMLSVSYQWTMMIVGKEMWRLTKLSKRPWWRRASKFKHYKEHPQRVWEFEYMMHTPTVTFLADENMKVVLHFGYMVLFPGANPLAPLMIFAYNLWALRYEARRALLRIRRPVPLRCAGIGPWMKLIKMLTFIGMGTNVLFIAFTSNFVTQMSRWFNPYYSNFIEFTFSQFAVDDYPAEFGAEVKSGREGTFCYYKGNRFPPSSARKYANTLLHWNIHAIQFLTVFVVQSLVIIFSGLLMVAISDTPHDIRESLRHRIYQQAQQHEAKFRREKDAHSTVGPELRDHFTVIGY